MKRALRLLGNNKIKDPDTIKNEFLKYGEKHLQFYWRIISNEYCNQRIYQLSKIYQLIDKGRKDKEKVDNKRGISLTSNMGKLFEKVIISRLNNHLQFTEAQAGAQPGKNRLSNLLASKSVIQQRIIQNQETYVAFIDLQKAFDKVWSSAVFYAKSEENFGQ